MKPGEWLAERPLLYAVSHQLIVIPLVAFLFFVSHPGSVMVAPVWGLTLVSLGGFFAYEVGRKLDPAAHPVIRTYRQVYGLGGSFVLTVAAVFAALAGAALMGASVVVAPVAAALLVTFAMLLVRPDRHAGVELAASVNLLVCLWSGVFQDLLSKFGIMH